ncbi:MAG: manganese-binding transcriptional regulator MntR [Phycisphaerales bacterium]
MTKKSPPDISQSERFRSTRRAHRDETAEDYVEAIDQLIDHQGIARVGKLAQAMGVSHVTVTRIIARLSKEGLVATSPRQPITLTAKGRAMAKASYDRHLAVLGFLRAIGVSEKQAQIDAEGIEHHVSPQTLRAIKALTKQLAEQ